MVLYSLNYYCMYNTHQMSSTSFHHWLDKYSNISMKSGVLKWEGIITHSQSRMDTSCLNLLVHYQTKASTHNTLFW